MLKIFVKSELFVNSELFSDFFYLNSMFTFKTGSLVDFTFDHVFVSLITGVKFNPRATAIAEFQLPSSQQATATSIRCSITLAACEVFDAYDFHQHMI